MTNTGTSISAPSFLDKKAKKILGEFGRWIAKSGGELLTPSNDYEVLRFKATEGTGIIYRDKVMRLRWTGCSYPVWLHFAKKETWAGAPKTERKTKGMVRRNHAMAALLKRDGPFCVFCGGIEGEDDARFTIEHFVPLSRGGADHLSNMGIAHQVCNAAAGNLSVAEKIKLAIMKRAED